MKQTTLQKLLAVDESLHGFRGKCSFKQYIPNKPSKYGINVFVLADSKTFYLVSSKIYMGAGIHALRLPVPTQAVLDLVLSISGTSRNITTDNYYTSISLAMELKSRELTWLARCKRTKYAFHPAFWRKHMKEHFNKHSTMQTISFCCPLLQRNTRGSYFCPLCIPKKREARIMERKK